MLAPITLFSYIRPYQTHLTLEALSKNIECKDSDLIGEIHISFSYILTTSPALSVALSCLSEVMQTSKFNFFANLKISSSGVARTR